MAITTDDFNKIWASTSPLTPYEFSESNYKEGWNFVGGTPPSRQMWDFLQKNNDEKMQYLADNYLPLSGGKMTGAIEGNPITLTADDGNGNSADLVLNADGSATLDGNNIITSAITGNILTATGNDTTENAFATLCSITTHSAGVWLITSYMDLNYNGTSQVYIHRLKTANHDSASTRNTPAYGGGNCAFLLTALDENEVVELMGYQYQAGTMRGWLKMVRLA